MFNLTHLRTLVALVQEKHLTRAADRLNISQPAASHHLRLLEQQFGLRLFTRTPRGIFPTAAGLQLATGAERLLSSSLELISLASELRGTPTGRLVIGIIEDAPVYACLPELVLWFGEQYPNIELCIESRNSLSVRHGILTGELTAGFFISSADDAQMRSYDLGMREFVVIAPKSWQKRVETALWQELASMPWVTTQQGSAHSDITDQVSRTHNVTLRRVLQVSNERLLQLMVANGIGLGFIRRETANKALDQGEICIIAHHHYATKMKFAHARSVESDLLVQILVRGLMEVGLITNLAS